MDEQTIANGMAAFAAVLFAWFSPEDRRTAAITIAAVLCLNWVHYVLSWTDHSFETMLWSVGLPLRVEDSWKAADAVCGCLAIWLAYDRWWGWALWSMWTIQSIAHCLFDEIRVLPDVAYYNVLDAVFLMQVAVFLLLGSGGVWEYVRRSNPSLRGVHSTLRNLAFNRFPHSER